VNDSYRTDVPLKYPPYMIALAALYIAFIIAEKSSPKVMATVAAQREAQTQAQARAQAIKSLDSAALASAIDTPVTRPPRPAGTPGNVSPSTQLPAIATNQTLAIEQGRKIIGRAQGAELFASLNVNMGTLFCVVEELIAVYPVWRELDPGLDADSVAAGFLADVMIIDIARRNNMSAESLVDGIVQQRPGLLVRKRTTSCTNQRRVSPTLRLLGY
jgi:hypothetical protein